MKKVFFAIAMVFTMAGYANDGVFYAKGNQLIPITESNIKIQKEILQISRAANNSLNISVYYEFFNPGDEKEVLVGFEAESPSGDVDASPKDGKHPYMRDFSVQLNDIVLPYSVSMVDEEVYYANGQFKKPRPESLVYDEHPNYVDFYYVYHFKAKFKKGLNTIKHNYNFDLSGSVMTAYEFSYVLTAANRWANNQIDDFTLIVSLGDFQEFCIDRSFFEAAKDWIITGKGRKLDLKGNGEFEIGPVTQFYLQNGNIIFQKKNFKPAGELNLVSWSGYPEKETFDIKSDFLPFDIKQQWKIQEPVDELSKKAIRNLPFARRGYVFKTKELQEFFERQPWYVADANYVSNMDDLTKEEKELVEKYSK
ncbi:YARHG domain-containing protein [Paracrocinitomix mangrovi]|uniref:YARHG domain-containing protein n=1 Tax=Paracrocinitomix mangrovi TaxID=2862509 RepID=UPI001C8F02B9|nr:YARHG domain-containing protein [Paracrocinitomix mangrovi]UKN02202.1 YARHG domain-containing protein [Paracrocinitomix mangrovi]